jgi:hypothetical protein
MNINFTDQQFEKLLKLVYLGMWVVEADEHNDDYFVEIEQLIYSQSKDIPGQKLIEYDESSKKYFPAIDFDKEDVIVKHIDAYEENIFWDELIDRLTKRDMIKKYGLEGIQKMSQDKVFECEKEFIEKYEQEFSNTGIENIGIL